MKPRPFDYIRPDTVDEALSILAEHGEDARILAGGQTLIAMLNLRVVEAPVLIDITRIRELDAIREVDGTVEIGATVTQNRLLQLRSLAEKLPLLHAVLPFVGHFQTRNKGTVCGSIAHADPASEIPLALALLGGQVMLRSQKGARTLSANEFQQGMLLTARAPDELITAVRFPIVNARVAFREVARRHGDFAIVAIAAAAENRESMRIGIAGMADRPAVRSLQVDGAASLQHAIERLAWELEGYDDIHASARMRRDLLRGLGPIVVEEARQQCAA
ncbi:MAG: FAD binding domain-containing protein [Xanthobacteraceae bacterium]